MNSQIEFQGNLILGAIIDAQIDYGIHDSEMPDILNWIQEQVQQARKDNLS